MSGHNSSASAVMDLQIQKPAVSHLLIALGVDLEGPYSAAIVLGAADVLLALDLAQSLPHQAYYPGALQFLHTFAEEPVVPTVREAQRKVLDLVAEEQAQDIQANPMLASRLAQLRSAVTGPRA
jgi:hypothetical protein